MMRTMNLSRFALWIALISLPLFARGNESLVGLFERANALYTQGQYDSAIMVYEQILDAGQASSVLHYNLGNAYFRQHGYAKSILNYERALKYDPTYSDAEFNLALARTFTADRFAGDGESVIWYRFKTLYRLVSPTTWGWLSLGGIGMLLVSILVFRYTRYRRMVPVSLLVAALSIVVAGSSFVLGRIAERALLHPGKAIIMQSVVSVKSEPTESGKDLFLLHAGSKVQYLRQSGEWCEIAIPDGHRGWVENGVVEEI